ncbi:hypothetical protein OIU80_19920 [Flavobacterium sp. LS1R47]|uniref:Uncharacterized protein n=1 Tax=Flavobacterium frigoritolerans TaxID=2987686 RepID=A0A9X3CAA9_9FLAO|nr:hypothetical protein [Flavobacterium frigoritolerans]MCV9934555.1 hypothetical protein [Flavobacterium frigoritolerans]
MEILALEGQSFLDLAIQGGSLEAIFEINPNISITNIPVIGEKYNIAIHDVPIANYYQRHIIEPATALSENDLSIIIPDDGIGAMIIENTFIIR